MSPKRKRPAKLPPEIRNLVYSFALILPESIQIRGNKAEYRIGSTVFQWKRKNVRYQKPWRHRDRSRTIAAAFLRSCKRVHAEARAILYASHFKVQDMETLAVWLRDLGPGNRACLRNIQIRGERQKYYRTNKSGLEAQQDRYREVCRKVGRLLVDAEHLESLQTKYFYQQVKLPRLSLRRPGADKKWVRYARQIAEVVYEDFRPVYSKALTRGCTPESLLEVLTVSRSNWWWSWRPFQRKQLPPKEATLVEEGFGVHMKLLLERNLKYRLDSRLRP
ncbi:hypothetical protein CCHL11_07049 [Colletotrichum chlorophyti]|uniref:DUF7730 domain-containing protein n=1 Tax=Colletotrichum chlorophyti TaxID=708187 RepID=A0A1Q8RCH8_9PEZI|nr:hypothetical protein CCHL11_07049 [Colletotrichum chlorophyti]